jgi:hypothetical protein
MSSPFLMARGFLESLAKTTPEETIFSTPNDKCTTWKQKMKFFEGWLWGSPLAVLSPRLPLLTHQFVVVGCCPEYSVSFPPRFTHGNMGCRTCFLPIFSEAAFFRNFFPYVRGPENTQKRFFSYGSGHTPFVVRVVTVAWGFIKSL